MESHFLLPQSKLNEIENALEEMRMLLKEYLSQPPRLTEWVSEQEAQKILGLKQTTLWYFRKTKKLSYSKVGNKTFYSVKSLERLVEKSAK